MPGNRPGLNFDSFFLGWRFGTVAVIAETIAAVGGISVASASSSGVIATAVSAAHIMRHVVCVVLCCFVSELRYTAGAVCSLLIKRFYFLTDRV